MTRYRADFMSAADTIPQSGKMSTFQDRVATAYVMPRGLRSTLRRFVESHRTELMERFIGEDVAWGLHGDE